MPASDPRLTSSTQVGGPVLDAEDLAALTHLLRKSKRRLPPPSFSLAPPTPLPLWQRVASSTIRRVEYEEDDQRQAGTQQGKLAKEVAKYHADVHAREERLRRQQREARAQNGSKLAVAVRRFWARRGEGYQQVARVEFDALKRHRDKRKQEDLLKETEDLTKRLLESLMSDSPREPAVDGTSSSGGSGSSSAEQTFRLAGKDGSVAIEAQLDLLDTDGGRRPLRSYQRSALHWMIHLFESKLNGILADEMGLGKTVQTIALLCYYAQYKNDWGPHLIVVPTTVILNWKAELARWAPGLKVLTYIGSAKERGQLRKRWTSEDAFHVCVTSYNLIVQDRRVFRRRPWGFLVLDEAHQVKNFMSKKWQSLFDLQAEYRLLLTGTPLQNSIMELWSLFHFLLPFASAFRSNDEFKEWFSNPMDDMITGRSTLNEDIVRRLQALIRPFMLRRLKKDVETQLPSKSEKVVMCRLSRRQRALYDDYMQLAETKDRLRGGGAGGVLSVLLGLRKVCDHPDLFEERPTVSPFVLDRFTMISLAVPRAVLLRENDYRGWYAFPGPATVEAAAPLPASACFDWLPCHLASVTFHVGDPASVVAVSPTFSARYSADLLPTDPNVSLLDSFIGARRAEFSFLEEQDRPADALLAACGLLLSAAGNASSSIASGHACTQRIQEQRHRDQLNAVHFPIPATARFIPSLREALIWEKFSDLCPTVAERSDAALPVIGKVAVYVPAAVSVFPPRLRCALPLRRPAPFALSTRECLASLVGFFVKAKEEMEGDKHWRGDLYDGSEFLAELWPAQVRRCFSFPDKRLIIHDCGKLQFLATALRQMRQEGHRMLIFTQFVGMLNIMERFLALIGVAYLRLDGSTRAEVRQAMVDRFNEDTKITCMILSTRSGGIGLNLTGADTVIFYDSDWNPTMDLQAQDRCHRIGQTRPVTIYRLVSEHTVEEAILEKARERKKLNNVVIRGGQFHSIAGVGEEYDDSAAAFAALSDPVNLRSFFHDYDEDVTLPAAAGVGGGAEPASSADILAEMGRVEDDEDREARHNAELELKQRDIEEAAERDDNDDDEAAAGATGAGPLSHSSAWRSRTEAVGAQEQRLDWLPPAGDEEEVVPRGHPELVEAGLMPAVHKRQREALGKQRTPLDRLLTAQYGVCHEDEAWARYSRLCDDFEATLIDNDAPDSGSDEDAHETLFPPFRSRFEL